MVLAIVIAVSAFVTLRVLVALTATSRQVDAVFAAIETGDPLPGEPVSAVPGSASPSHRRLVATNLR